MKLGHHGIINIQKALVMEESKSASHWKVMFYKARGVTGKNLADTHNHGKHKGSTNVSFITKMGMNDKFEKIFHAVVVK